MFFQVTKKMCWKKKKENQYEKRIPSNSVRIWRIQRIHFLEFEMKVQRVVYTKWFFIH